MEGAATNAQEPIFPLAQAGQSDTIYSREEVDGVHDVLEAGRRSMLQIHAELSHVVPLDGIIEFLTYVEELASSDVLPYICDSAFWHSIDRFRDSAHGPEIQKNWIIVHVMRLLSRNASNNSIQYDVQDERYVEIVDSVLRAALNYNGGVQVIRILVAMCPFVVTHPKGDTRLLAAHDAMLYGCEIAILKELTKLRSVCRHRDASGRTLLHWGVLCNMPITTIKYLYEQFPDAINCPTFQGTGGIIDSYCLAGTQLGALRGNDEDMEFSGGCTPLCLALDVNMCDTPPQNNYLSIVFLVKMCTQTCLVPDNTGQIAFHKLLRGSYCPDVFSKLIVHFVERHMQSAQCVPFLRDNEGLTLLESAFRLRLPAEIIDIIGRFTSNMVEPMLVMIKDLYKVRLSLPVDKDRDARPWSLLVYPLLNSDNLPTLPCSGLPFMASNENKPDHVCTVINSFIFGEDAIVAFSPEYDATRLHPHVHQTPIQYRRWTQLVMSKRVSEKMMLDLGQIFTSRESTFSSVLRHLQRSQKVWYARYRKELREQNVNMSDDPILGEDEAAVFFAPRQPNAPLRNQRVVVRTDESERHAIELLQSLEDEQQLKANKANAKPTLSRKARQKLATQERDRVAQDLLLHEKEARETAAAIAQAAAAVLRERIRTEETFAREAATRNETREKEKELATQTEENTARVLGDLEAEIQRLENTNLESCNAAISYLFDTMRTALLIAEQDIADAKILHYATDLIVHDMISVLETENVMTDMLRPQLLDQLQFVLPGFAEREAQREADRVELETLRAAVKEDREARECVVCLTHAKNVLLRPCMHMAICQQCFDSTKPKECPICRGVVSSGEVYYT